MKPRPALAITATVLTGLIAAVTASAPAEAQAAPAERPNIVWILA